MNHTTTGPENMEVYHSASVFSLLLSRAPDTVVLSLGFEASRHFACQLQNNLLPVHHVHVRISICMYISVQCKKMYSWRVQDDGRMHVTSPRHLIIIGCNSANISSAVEGVTLLNNGMSTTSCNAKDVSRVLLNTRLDESSFGVTRRSVTARYVWSHMWQKVWINRVRSPILLAVSRTGKINISLSAFAPENLASRDEFGSPVPRRLAHLHTQAESDACYGIPPEFRSVCIYGHIYSKSMDQPRKVANPARGQLNRET